MAADVVSRKKNQKNKRKDSEEENSNDTIDTKKNAQIRKNSKESSHTVSTKSNAFTVLIFIFLSSFLTLLIGMLLIELHVKQMGIADLIHAQFYNENRQHLTKMKQEHTSKQSIKFSSDIVKENIQVKTEETIYNKQDEIIEPISNQDDKANSEGPVRTIDKINHKDANKLSETSNISKERLSQIEEEIIPEDVDTSTKLKKEKNNIKDEPSKLNINPNNINAKSTTPTRLIDLYTEVEKMTEEILDQDPENDIIQQLAPHLQGVIRDMNSDKLNGIEEALLHIREILLDLKIRLKEASKVKQSGEKSDNIPKSTDKFNPEYSGKIPVEEIIPDPVYIAPLGSKEKTESTLDGKRVEKEGQILRTDKKIESKREVDGGREFKPQEKIQTQPNVEDEIQHSKEQFSKDQYNRKDNQLKENRDKSKENQDKLKENRDQSKEIKDKSKEKGNKLKENKQDRVENIKKEEQLNQNEKIVGQKEKENNLKSNIVSNQEKVDISSNNINTDHSSDFKSNQVNPTKLPLDKSDLNAAVKENKDNAKPSKETKTNFEEKSNQKEFEDLLQSAELLIKKNPNESLRIFNKLLETHPKSVNALLGKAKSLDALADVEKSNQKLEEAIATYALIVDIAEKSPGTVPKDILITAGETCAERMTFRGWRKKAVSMFKTLGKHFPNEPRIQNKLGRAYLMMMDTASAKKTFEEVLREWPEDGFAQVHYGFILKTSDNNINESIKYLLGGIRSGAQETVDGRFYLHLGDAYQRIGDDEKADAIFDEGVNKGLFLSRYQRSLYNIDRLKSRPIWTLGQTTYEHFFKKLAANWKKIREEGVKALQLSSKQGFQPESENLQKSGEWNQFTLFSQGQKSPAACDIAPFTCSLIEAFPNAASNKRGQIKFSVMKPGTSVYKHTGPTNCRLRAHLGLITPPGAKMKVVDTELTWKAGEILVFDDSFQHEVWHEGNSLRLILIVDVWHPDITYEEKLSLSPI